MLRPSELLDAARLLASSQHLPLTDGRIRRAISTDYYALFHAVLTAGADRFFGATGRNRPGYAIVYRSFDHGRMKKACEDAARGTLTQTLQRQVRRAAFGPDLRDFANAFVLLQASRHIADYDPTAALQHADALAAIDRAERAIVSLNGAPDDERSDLLALMLGGSRS